MDLFFTFVPLISIAIAAGVFVMALMNFSTLRKNMRMQSEQQMETLKAQSEQQMETLKAQSEQVIYSRIMDARLKLESTDIFTDMAKESPIFAERFTLVDSPDEYYLIVAFLDLFEFLFHLNKEDMIDTEIWYRYKGLAKTIMTIPKFKRVWNKTKDVHADEFRNFIDSL
jgi:hypothetical protein